MGNRLPGMIYVIYESGYRDLEGQYTRLPVCYTLSYTKANKAVDAAPVGTMRSLQALPEFIEPIDLPSK